MHLSQTQIENQYAVPGLLEKILEELKVRGVDTDKFQKKDVFNLDDFSIRGADVSGELAGELYLKNSGVLDVGCGLGGVSRMLAGRFNCRVTGIDLCKTFIRTAKQLSSLTGLIDKTEFILADALEMPFENGMFDIVWTQHVQMNIDDKAGFYSEIKRVLKREGIFIYYDIFKNQREGLRFPLPWADNPAFSFLETFSFADTLLTEMGFAKLQVSDQTPQAAQYLERLLKNNNKAPKQGLHILTGKDFKKKITNLLKNIEEHRIELRSGIYRKMNQPEINDLKSYFPEPENKKHE